MQCTNIQALDIVCINKCLYANDRESSAICKQIFVNLYMYFIAYIFLVITLHIYVCIIILRRVVSRFLHHYALSVCAFPVEIDFRNFDIPRVSV